LYFPLFVLAVNLLILRDLNGLLVVLLQVVHFTDHRKPVNLLSLILLLILDMSFVESLMLLDNLFSPLISLAVVPRIDEVINVYGQRLRPVSDEHGVLLVDEPQTDGLVYGLYVEASLDVEGHKASCS
jgi:hypothetical protein